MSTLNSAPISVAADTDLVLDGISEGEATFSVHYFRHDTGLKFTAPAERTSQDELTAAYQANPSL